MEKVKVKVQKKYKKLTRGPAKARSKTLLQYRDYEAILYQGRRKLIPRFILRPIPPKPVTLQSLGGSVDGDAEALKGFPYSSMNKGELIIGFPRMDGYLGVSLQDPPLTLDLDEQRREAEVSYGSDIPNIGKVDAKLRSSGDWSANLERELEDVGLLTGSMDSQSDWSVDLEKSYETFRFKSVGVTPTVKYGATQDGMRVAAKFESPVGSSATGEYVVSNVAGKYSPSDFLHDCKIVGKAGDHSLTAQAKYDRRLPKIPLRASLAYVGKFGPAGLQAVVGYDDLRLLCSVPHAQVSAKVARQAMQDGTRPAEVELQVGQASIVAKLVDDKPPRLLFNFAR